MGLNFVLGSNMLSQHILEHIKLQPGDSALLLTCSAGWLLHDGDAVPLKRRRRKKSILFKKSSSMYGWHFSNVMEDYFVLYMESSGKEKIYLQNEKKRSAECISLLKMIFW